ncbi:hypothetical protein CTRI78_v008652 [Colletotrichum trifolii]|uniref:Uncharacterized protein n=1 Tax=Colletotrichum trifolii TaxID=5466 RepID=A0A4R8QX03_COLTR|nr:hypothetical protein CTRI78_v008652 [Colletotrichum trifolii]
MCIPRPRRHSTKIPPSATTRHPYTRLASPPPTPRISPPPKPQQQQQPVCPIPQTIALNAASHAQRAPVVAPQHERLLLDLVPFKDAAKFHSWLESPFVRGPWNEFVADFLSRPGSPAAVPEPDRLRTAQAAQTALNSKKARYLVHHPDKADWTPEEHYVRFIVTLVSDNMLQNFWHESEWKKKGLDIAKASYEVLVFLKGSWFADPEPPSYSA